MPGALRLALRLRRSVFITVALIMSVLVIGLYFAVQTISGSSFHELERQAVIDDAARVQQAYEANLTGLDRVSGDWAPWDDTYEFVLGAYPEYAGDNLGAETLANLGLSVMAFYDTEGTLVHLSVPDVASGVAEQFGSDLRALGEDPRLSGWEGVEDVAHGLAPSSLGPLMFSARPILTSTFAWPPAGTLLVGRVVDDEVVAGIADATRLSVERVDIAGLTSEQRAAREPIIEVVDDDTIAATVVLRDWSGAPALGLTAVTGRPIVQQGKAAADLLGLALAALSFVSGAALVYAFRQEQQALEAQLEAERDARESEERYRGLVETMADAVFGVGGDGLVFYANPRAERLLGSPRDAIVGRHFSALMTPDSAQRVTDSIARDMGSVATWELSMLDADGRVAEVEVGVSWFAEHDADRRMQWIARDIAERKRFENELIYLATHDHLTGLFNRRRFEEELETALANARRTGVVAVLLWLDLDNFKEVNDSLGHKAGDDILAGMALHLTRTMRADTVIARLGGDEFALLMPRAERDEVPAIVTRVLESVRQMQHATEGGTVHLTASVGVVLLPDHATTAEEALARADLAMYRAKDGGRNRVCVYEPGEDWDKELRARFDWAVTIETALREDRFAVHWQPILDLDSGAIDRYELLIRLNADDGTVVPPGAFLPVAEHLGLINAIDRYMVQRAIGLLASMPPAERVRVDVNFSGKALSDAELPEMIASALMDAGVEPEWLGIEVTETAAVVDMIKARSFIEGLKSIGVRVSLDDFGSGFSSFYYLRHLPIDTLKIDGSFVREMVGSTRDQHVVCSIVELARGLGIDTTAECVEDAETLEMLRSFGIRFAQGFHIGRPGPVQGDRSSDAIASV